MDFYKHIDDKLYYLNDEMRQRAFMKYLLLFQIKYIRNTIIYLPWFMTIVFFLIIVYIKMRYELYINAFQTIIIVLFSYGLIKLITKYVFQNSLNLMIDRLHFELSYYNDLVKIIMEITEIDTRILKTLQITLKD